MNPRGRETMRFVESIEKKMRKGWCRSRYYGGLKLTVRVPGLSIRTV